MKKKLQSISNIANKRNHIIAISGCLVIIGIILMLVCMLDKGGVGVHKENNQQQTSSYDELNNAMNERLESLNKTVNLDYSSLIEEEQKRLENLEDDLKNTNGGYAKWLQDEIKKSKATIADYQQLLNGVVGGTK